MSRGRLSRRQFLNAIGAAGALLPLARPAHGLQSTPALDAYPMLEKTLRAAADRGAQTISRRAAVTLTARDGAYAPDLARLNVDAPSAAAQRIAPDGLLTFTVETDEPLYLSGELELEPSNDLRPGLRVSVLCDDTLVAAPMLAEVRQARNRGFPRVVRRPQGQFLDDRHTRVRPAGPGALPAVALTRVSHHFGDRIPAYAPPQAAGS